MNLIHVLPNLMCVNLFEPKSFKLFEDV